MILCMAPDREVPHVDDQKPPALQPRQAALSERPDRGGVGAYQAADPPGQAWRRQTARQHARGDPHELPLRGISIAACHQPKSDPVAAESKRSTSSPRKVASMRSLLVIIPSPPPIVRTIAN